ncbi:MAG: DUF6444 domain-containing protein [Nocardioidaceae bacterium]
MGVIVRVVGAGCGADDRVFPPLAVQVAQVSAAERALRGELAELRAQLAERDRAIVLLSEENAVLRRHDAAQAQRLVALVERVEELERRVGQNPRNSHKPPSSQGYDKPAPRSRRERTDREPGGQPGHQGRTLRQVEFIELDIGKRRDAAAAARCVRG